KGICGLQFSACGYTENHARERETSAPAGTGRRDFETLLFAAEEYGRKNPGNRDGHIVPDGPFRNRWRSWFQDHRWAFLNRSCRFLFAGETLSRTSFPRERLRILFRYHTRPVRLREDLRELRPEEKNLCRVIDPGDQDDDGTGCTIC